jgi:hypothetical protein
MMPNSIDVRKLRLGYYEAENPPDAFLENRGVPDFGFNVVNRRNPLYRPIADEKLSENDTKPQWPDGRGFAVCLTNDVDHVSIRSSAQLRGREEEK